MSSANKVFCIGQMKSGTVSLYGMLAGRHRAAHEPEREETFNLIRERDEKAVDTKSFRDVLRRRAERLNLEYDIAWANQFLVDDLLDLFPEARFVCLIRDPYSWLPSIIGHHLCRPISPDVRAFLNWWLKPTQFPFTRHDAALEQRGVYSIASFLNAWNEHISTCTLHILPKQRLIVRTHELDTSHERIADFLHIPAESLNPKWGHVNKGIWKGQLDELIDPMYLREIVESRCAEYLARYFPDRCETG